jgi:hypothetical protein
MKSRQRSWLGNYLLVALSIIMCSLTAEGVLRLLPDLGHDKKSYYFKVTGDLYRYGAGPANIVLKPSATYHVATPEYDYTAYTNALGLRDYEFPKAKPPGTVRIGIFNSSVVFGAGVPLDEIFAKRLERQLAADPPLKDKWFQVIDLGIPSYSSGQDYLTVRDFMLQLDIDVVVLAHVASDAMEWPFIADSRGLPKDYRVSMEQWRSKRPDLPPGSPPKDLVPAWLDVWSRYSRIASLARDAWSERQLRKYQTQSVYPIGDVWQDPFWPMRKSGYESEEQWKLHERITLETAQLATAAGRKFLLVTIPVGAQLNGYEWDWGRAQQYFEPGVTVSDEPQKRIRDLLSSNGYAALDVLPPLQFTSTPEHRMFFPYDGHLTPKGHEVVAKEIEHAIRVMFGGVEKAGPESLLNLLVVAAPDAELHVATSEADIVTPPQQYNYAARLPFDEADERKFVTGVRVKIEIVEGRAQFGILDQSGLKWISLSEPLSVGPEQSIDLHFPATKSGMVVFANSAVSDGQRAKMKISEITLLGEGDCKPTEAECIAH